MVSDAWDEATATMAIMDVLNFFASKDSFDDLRKKVFRSMTLHFVPMLNPDGAERFKRRNALGIDLNRDADRLSCPESRMFENAERFT